MSITLQPWKLQLLSIPKAYPQSIKGCTHAIVKNIFFPRSRDTLFSFSQNALELAIVADTTVIAEDFVSLRLEGMMVTDDVFSAFMVDDPDGIDNSGRRINELSALLSRNGISIFYLSTRITDLILVKEKRLKLVLPTIRAFFSLSVDSDCDLSSSGRHSRGFSSESDQGSFPSSSFTSVNSFLHTPSSPSRTTSVHYQYPPHQHHLHHPSSPAYTHHPVPASSFSSSYSSSFSSSALHGVSFGSSLTKPSTGITIPFGRQSNYSSHASVPRGRFFHATGRHSDSDSSSVDGTHGTGTAIAGTHGPMTAGSGSQPRFSSSAQRGRQSSIAESSFGDSIGRYFPRRHPHNSSFDSFDSLSTPLGDTTTQAFSTRAHPSARHQGKDIRTGNSDMASITPLTPIASSIPMFGSTPSIGLMHETLEEQEIRELKIKDQIRRSCPRSVIDSKLILAGLAPEYQAEWAVTLLKVLFYPEELPGLTDDSKTRFISFTTTDEGTSLIADQEVLGHFEEHMLNLSETMLRCIQVDLSTFGLDTYGLVYSMSNPLVDHGVNLLCLSTFRTANVLVQDSDLETSLKVLSMSA